MIDEIRRQISDEKTPLLGTLGSRRKLNFLGHPRKGKKITTKKTFSALSTFVSV